MLDILDTESGRKRADLGRIGRTTIDAIVVRNFSSSDEEPNVPSSDTEETYNVVVKFNFYNILAITIKCEITVAKVCVNQCKILYI